MAKVANTDQLERLIVLSANAIELVRENKRTPRQVLELLDTLQAFKGMKGLEFSESGIYLEWYNFYRRYFGLDVDFSGLQIPPKQDEFDYILIIAKGLTINRVYNACRKEFRCQRKNYDLDETVSENSRIAQDTYVIRVRAHVKNQKEKEILHDGYPKINGITLLERLLYELKVYDETGKHSRTDNLIVCYGSACEDGTPVVFSSGGELVIHLNTEPCHQFRQVVS